jgi:hypothetical protein
MDDDVSVVVLGTRRNKRDCSCSLRCSWQEEEAEDNNVEEDNNVKEEAEDAVENNDVEGEEDEEAEEDVEEEDNVSSNRNGRRRQRHHLGTRLFKTLRMAVCRCERRTERSSATFV